MIAYVDESLRLDGEGRYVLAAVLVPDARADEVRAALRSTLRRGQRRYHWHDEGPASRLAVTRVVAALGLDAVAVTSTPVDGARQERARRRCLRVLLWEVERRGIEYVVLESRHRPLDLADAQMIAHAGRAGWISRNLRYAFCRPSEEPLLWLPDIVSGVVMRALVDRESRYLDLLGARVATVTAP
ncbi:MAG TPA: hypothetical protein VNQ77_16850 [Frankiaceae bacterium]|nr:hypothetical protein [Frankiaceae bacterium]